VQDPSRGEGIWVTSPGRPRTLCASSKGFMTDPQQGYSFRLSAWAGLRSQQIICRNRESIDRLIDEVDRDLARLAGRIEVLETRFDPNTKTAPHYMSSKRLLRPDTAVTEGAAVTAPPVRHKFKHRFDPLGRSWGGEPPALLRERLSHARRVLVVGELKKGGTLARMSSAAAATKQLHPGEGIVCYAHHPLPNRYRPGQASFAHWLACASENDRMQLDAILLGDGANRMDVELLFRRLYPRTLVATEPGSAATAWLSALWDGSISRSADALFWALPGMRFREPGGVSLPSGLHWPKISVVTVSYNQGKFLETCLRSVIDQGYPNLEYIVIDACSTDESPGILRRYSDYMSRLIIERDNGQSDGLSKGFSLATGSILTWVNSDDALGPNSLRRAALAFLEHDVDIVAGTCERIREANDALIRRHYAALPTSRPVELEVEGPLRWADSWEKGDYFFQPEVFFSRDIWERAGAGLKSHLYWAMDWDLWLRFAAAGARVIRIPDVLGVSRVQPEQKTTKEQLYLPQIAGILQEYRHVYKLIADRWDGQSSAANHTRPSLKLSR
jgi:GT2 family glycosyltransferase